MTLKCLKNTNYPNNVLCQSAFDNSISYSGSVVGGGGLAMGHSIAYLQRANHFTKAKETFLAFTN